MDKMSFLRDVKKACPRVDICKIAYAFDVAEQSHAGQYRKTGEPFFKHPVRVTLLAAKYVKTTDVLCASLLHDTVEDTHLTVKEIEERFGEKVAFIVEGLTKRKGQSAAGAFQKVLRYGKKERSIVILKLVDKIDNLETIHVFSKQRQKELLQEVEEKYIPLARHMRLPQIEKTFQRAVKS